MSNVEWSFEAFANWLTAQSQEFRSTGYLVELHRHDGPRSSIRLRLEREGRVGELTVWNDGMASEAVIDLKVGDFVHMRDGTQLCSSWDVQLAAFFAETANEPPPPDSGRPPTPRG